jgi:hypothetical protein
VSPVKYELGSFIPEDDIVTTVNTSTLMHFEQVLPDIYIVKNVIFVAFVISFFSLTDAYVCLVVSIPKRMML